MSTYSKLIFFLSVLHLFGIHATNPIAPKATAKKERRWGLLKTSYVPPQAMQIKSSATSNNFDVAHFNLCINSLLKAMASPLKSTVSEASSRHFALLGKNKDVVLAAMLNEKQAFVILHPEYGEWIIPWIELAKPGTYLTRFQEKGVDIFDLEMTITNQEILSGPTNSFSKSKDNKITKTHYKLPNVSKSVQSLEGLIEIFAAFMLEFRESFDEKVHLSQLHARYDYHGLLEFSALSKCRQKFSKEPEILSSIEKTMEHISPNWRKELKIK